MKTRFAVSLAMAMIGCGGERTGTPEAAPDSQVAAVHPLLDLRAMSDTAPPLYRVRFETTEGPVQLEVTGFCGFRWSPGIGIGGSF